MKNTPKKPLIEPLLQTPIDLKIAFVCGHFVEGFSYVENDLALAFAKAGNEVCVFTSSVRPAYVGGFTPSTKETGPLKIKRCPNRFHFGQIVIPQKLRRSVEAFQPDLAVVVGLGKYWPMPVLRAKASYKIMVLLGDNAHSQQGNKRMGFLQKILWNTLKKPVYEKAFRVADCIFAYTPDAGEVLKNRISENAFTQFHQKLKLTNLGFDPVKFSFSKDLRNTSRELKNWRGRQVILIPTRVVASKKLEEWLMRFQPWLQKDPANLVCVVGIGEDQYGEQFEQFVKSLPQADQIELLPFASSEELNRLFNAADLGFWPQPAISIQQALATGLFVMLPDFPSTSFLVNSKTGFVFPELTTESIENAFRQSKDDRGVRADTAAERFSWPNIARKLLEEIG